MRKYLIILLLILSSSLAFAQTEKIVPIQEFLDFLSQEEGFIIYSNKVEGNITDAHIGNYSTTTETLNAALYEQGYTSTINERTLKVVEKENAHKELLPIVIGNDPEKINRNYNMVTQIVPLKRAKAKEVLNNIKPFLRPYVVVMIEEDSNSIIITDIQMNIRRIVQIIQYLDVTEIRALTIGIFPIKFADASDIASSIEQIFSIKKINSNDKEEIIIAISETRTNSLIVMAPNDTLKEIDELLKEIDIEVDDPLLMHIIPLKNANAEETATMITEMFGVYEEEQVKIVADNRTNYLIIVASNENIDKIILIAEDLDYDNAKRQEVFFYPLGYAGAEDALIILQELFGKRN